MKSDSRFGIRLKPSPGESLSSYLMRSTKANFVDVLDLQVFIKTHPSLTISKPYLLNMIPELVVDIKKISSLLLISKELLEGMTFFPVILKFYSQAELYRLREKRLRTIISKYIIKDRRRFCSECLKKGLKYQLLWQVAELEICNVHLTKLSSQCVKCELEQPQRMMDVTDYYQCVNGIHDLRMQTQETTLKDELEEQLRKYDDWKFLLNPLNSLIPNVEGLSNNQTLILMLLYITQTDKSKFGVDCNIVLSRGAIYYLKRTFTQMGDEENNRIDFNRFLQIVRDSRLTLKEFSEVRVPNEFKISVLESIKTKVKFTPCLTPWCESYRSEKTIIMVENNNRIHINKSTFNRHSVCTSCWMEYGIDISDNNWKSISNWMEMITKTRELLNFTQSKSEICRLMGVSRNITCKILGYLSYHGLMSNELSDQFGPTQDFSGDLVETFRTFVQMERNGGLLRTAIKLGWDNRTFHHFLANGSVQRYLFFDARLDRNSFQKFVLSRQKHDKKQIEAKLDEVIKLFIEKKLEIKTKEIAQFVGISLHILYLNGLTSKIKDAAVEQRKTKKKNEESLFWILANDYIEEIEKANMAVTSKDVASYLGINNMCNRYPELSKKISSKIQVIKRQRTIASTH